MTLKSIFDKEKRAIRYTIYIQRLLAVVWGYAACMVWKAPFLESVGLSHPAALDTAEGMHWTAFGLAALLLSLKWIVVYGIMDFSGHETSFATIALLVIAIGLLAKGLIAPDTESGGKEYASIGADEHRRLSSGKADKGD